MKNKNMFIIIIVGVIICVIGDVLWKNKPIPSVNTNKVSVGKTTDTKYEVEKISQMIYGCDVVTTIRIQKTPFDGDLVFIETVVSFNPEKLRFADILNVFRVEHKGGDIKAAMKKEFDKGVQWVINERKKRQ